MDTSKDYVQMCSQAKELQDIWKPSIGDFYNGYRINVVCTQELIDTISTDIREHKADAWVTWLPRQDQLQTIVGYPGGFVFFNFYFKKPLFYEKKKPMFPLLYFNSGEQCWLAFVMKDKFGKVWNGEDWVKK